MLEIILIIYVLNLILDFPLQGDFLGQNKSKSNYLLFVHSMIWGGGIAIALMYFGMFTWWKLAMLVIGHMLIDAWKCRGHYKKCGFGDMEALYYDQMLHIIQLLLCVVF